jgi:hypothetical protein
LDFFQKLFIGLSGSRFRVQWLRPREGNAMENINLVFIFNEKGI